MDNPYGESLWRTPTAAVSSPPRWLPTPSVTPWPAAAIPMENPYCSCEQTSHGLQLQSLWRIPTAAVSSRGGPSARRTAAILAAVNGQLANGGEVRAGGGGSNIANQSLWIIPTAAVS